MWLLLLVGCPKPNGGEGEGGFVYEEGLRLVHDGAFGFGDADGDGDVDVLYTGVPEGSGIPETTWLLVNEGGALAETDAGITGLSEASFGFGHLDSDGVLDVASVGFDGYAESAKVWRGQGGSFVEAGSLSPCTYGDALWGDADNDGDLDLHITGMQGSIGLNEVYWNQGGDLVDGNAGMQMKSASNSGWADWDGDRDLDLAVCGIPGDTALYRNDGGVFVAQAVLPGAIGCSLSFGDFDLDGDPDLAVAGTGDPDLANVFVNDGAGNFADGGFGLQGVRAGQIAWGDYDGDGDPDLALQGLDGVTGEAYGFVYRNEGTGFADAGVAMRGLSLGGLGWADLDGDGALELLQNGMDDGGGYHAGVYRNQLEPATAAPEAPSGLSATVADGAVELSWQPDPRYTYDLRVGTTSGADDVAPRLSLEDGTRTVVEYGRIPAASGGWRLALPAGSYTWSVQAIDAAYRGSPWAEEGTFTVP